MSRRAITKPVLSCRPSSSLRPLSSERRTSQSVAAIDSGPLSPYDGLPSPSPRLIAARSARTTDFPVRRRDRWRPLPPVRRTSQSVAAIKGGMLRPYDGLPSPSPRSMAARSARTTDFPVRRRDRWRPVPPVRRTSQSVDAINSGVLRPYDGLPSPSTRSIAACSARTTDFPVRRRDR
jgi:hypothetical protein